jgi:hypothetical protein
VLKNSTDGSTIEAWRENKHGASCLAIMTSSKKVHIGSVQLKGSALLWRKALLPQLNMVVKVVLGERFRDK